MSNKCFFMPTPKLLTIAMVCLKFFSAHAGFLTVNESGELAPQEKILIGLEPQIRVTDGSGFNGAAFFDTGLSDEWSTRVKLGGGYDDLFGAFSLKWVPIPDFKNQPAIGVRADSSLGRKEGDSNWTFRLSPIVSKGFDLDEGKVIPYAALPLGILARKGSSKSITHLVLGSELLLISLPKSRVSAEVGFNLNNSFSYISGSWSWSFDL
jgi:hypothetical protein